jgi:hypothetical protein
VRGIALEQLHQPVHPELRITADEQMHVIGHDLKLDEFLPPAFDLLGKDSFETLVYRLRQYLAPILRAEDDVLSTGVDDVVVAAHGGHAGSRTQ